MSDPISPDDLKRYFPGASASTIRANQGSKANPVGVPAPIPQCPERRTLDRPLPRKETGIAGPQKRYRIAITIFAVRPCDWDNWHTKYIQDGLIRAGLLPGDSWNQLEGSIKTQKARNKAEERTEVEIFQLA